MADDLERWAGRPLERRSPERQPYTFGVAQESERLRQGLRAPAAPAAPVVEPPIAPDLHPLDHRPWQCWREARRRPVDGRTLSHLRTSWASSDRRPTDVWHRIMCRCGRHDIRGGEQVQLGSRFVRLERRCYWCDAAPTG